MRIWRLSLLASLLAATAACHDSKPTQDAGKDTKPPVAATPPPTELVTLAWTPANSNQNLQSFDLTLTGADVISVCRKPPGWVLERTDGGIEGYATVGAGFVSVEHLGDLNDLFLIRPQAGQTLGVSGKLLTGVYADDGGQSELAATPALLRRSPARECPKP
jgi:hypothetical protein